MKSFSHKVALLVLGAASICAGAANVAGAAGIVRTTTVDGKVQIQKTDQAEAEQLLLNMPVIEGDRVWTERGSRVELQFETGAYLRLDAYTDIEFTYIGSSSRGPIVRLWEGSLYLDTVGDEGIEIETPASSAAILGSGIYRIDVDRNGDTRVTVHEGAAEVAGQEGSAIARSGERTFIEVGYSPDKPFRFNRYRTDAFDDWNETLMERYTSSADYDQEQSLPKEVQVYYPELSSYGAWQHSDAYSSTVWVPRVSVGWRPYYNGYWRYCNGSPFWVSYEPWGWGPYHYGRWGFSISLGWHWIPGGVYSGAWVSWCSGPSYTAWCPIDYWGYPCIGYRGYFPHGRDYYSIHHWRGHKGPRKYYIDPHSWTAIKHSNMVGRDVKKYALAARQVEALSPARKIRAGDLTIKGKPTAANVAKRARLAYSATGNADSGWLPSKNNPLGSGQKHAFVHNPEARSLQEEKSIGRSGRGMREGRDFGTSALRGGEGIAFRSSKNDRSRGDSGTVSSKKRPVLRNAEPDSRTSRKVENRSNTRRSSDVTPRRGRTMERETSPRAGDRDAIRSAERGRSSSGFDRSQRPERSAAPRSLRDGDSDSSRRRGRLDRKSRPETPSRRPVPTARRSPSSRAPVREARPSRGSSSVGRQSREPSSGGFRSVLRRIMDHSISRQPRGTAGSSRSTGSSQKGSGRVQTHRPSASPKAGKPRSSAKSAPSKGSRSGRNAKGPSSSGRSAKRK